MKKILLLPLIGFLGLHLQPGALFINVQGAAYAQGGWKQEFAEVCGNTPKAMEFSPDELRGYIDRCNKLESRDYYSGVHFEAYVSGLGAPLAGGGRYDHMLGRFGYECPATGFAFEVGRAMLAMESQGVAGPSQGPDFFIIDFTAEKTRALALARRYRDLGASAARDIISRGLEDSLAYARQQRARWALVLGSGAGDADAVRVIDLGTGGERLVAVADLLGEPSRHFAVFGSGGHA